MKPIKSPLSLPAIAVMAAGRAAAPQASKPVVPPSDWVPQELTLFFQPCHSRVRAGQIVTLPPPKSEKRKAKSEERASGKAETNQRRVAAGLFAPLNTEH